MASHLSGPSPEFVSVDLEMSENASIPVYKTAGSAGCDFAASQEIHIAPHAIAVIPTGIIMNIPADHFLMITSRSSLAVKKGLIMANGVGIIDSDYCGPEDEIKILVYNFRNGPITVAKGERIAQGIFFPRTVATFSLEYDPKVNPQRGGLGSTGGYKK